MYDFHVTLCLHYLEILNVLRNLLLIEGLPLEIPEESNLFQGSD